MSTPLYRSRPSGFDIQPASLGVTQLNDFLYLSEGLSNSFLIVTPEGRVVVNTGMGFEAPIHKQNYDAIDVGPLRYIILTQGHVDHVGGVDLMREPGTEIVAQANIRAQQEDDARIQPFRASRSAFAFRETIAKAIAYVQENVGGPVSPQSRPDPTITFDDRYEFELGGMQFELIAVPGGETTDSSVIWLPQHRICFTGNLFSALFGHFPNLVTIRGDRYREALRFIESLDRVLALEPELLLVGHHAPVEGWDLIREELLRLRGAVEYVHDEVVRGMNDGRSVETLMRDIQLPSEFEVGEGYGKVSWSVRAIWENYAGWFHHRSATELYHVPAASVHADLVELAGGSDAIVKQAEVRLAAGDPLEAIHLAEIVLTPDPAHAGAREVSAAAHEGLDAESENFWLSSWLRRKIAALREGGGA